jgi:uncharacterized protein (DUF488 family)
VEVYTIGFTKNPASEFFGALKRAGVRRLLDVRLQNSSQLAGFAKRGDLEFFLREICAIEYIHEPLLAPTKEILDAYKKRKGSWDDYVREFTSLMKERRIEEVLDRKIFDVPTALLCSEKMPEHCHRRLVLEYLLAKWGGFSIIHL